MALRIVRLWAFVVLCGIAVAIVDGSRLIAQDQLDDARQLVDAIEQATQAAIRKASRSVVAISRAPKQRVGRAQLNSAMNLGQGWNSSPLLDPDFVPVFFGSGVVVASDGYIVTCAHVLGDPRDNDYAVWLDHEVYSATVVKTTQPLRSNSKERLEESPAGRAVLAEVLAADAFSDLAVLKIDAMNLAPVVIGETSGVQRGQFVIALGNPDAMARDGVSSASWGMISNLHRPASESGQGEVENSRSTIHGYGTLLQVDSRIAPGTSGGALVDLDGKLIGLMTNLTVGQGQGRAAGLAIAADGFFLRVVERLKAGRLPDFGFLGIQPDNLRLQERRQGHQGAIVRAVLRGLPGDRAGLQPDDVIVQVNANKVFSRDDLFRELSQVAANDEVVLLVARLGQPGVTRPIRALLSKKPALANDISFAVNEPKPWRGMRVDYATALPAELLIAGVFGQEPESRPRLAAIEVAPGSMAWQAGIRAGDGLGAVAGVKLETPDAFYGRASALPGEVTIEIVSASGRLRSVVVSANAVAAEPVDNF